MDCPHCTSDNVIQSETDSDLVFCLTCNSHFGFDESGQPYEFDDQLYREELSIVLAQFSESAVSHGMSAKQFGERMRQLLDELIREGFI